MRKFSVDDSVFNMHIIAGAVIIPPYRVRLAAD